MNETTGNLYTDLLLRTHNLLALACTASKMSVYAVVQHVGPDGRSVLSLGDWAGEPVAESRASYVAHAKAAEMLYAGASEGLSMTPTSGFEFSLGWQGGVRWDSHIVGVSKLAQEHDRMLALCGLFSMKRATRFHHAGFRHISEAAARQAAERLAVGTKFLPVDDHLRWYTKVPDHRAPNGVFYIEQQYFPEGKKTPAVHLDFATTDPYALLRLISLGAGVEPIWFEAPGPNDPIGVVWVTAKDTTLGIMARPEWWKVPIDK